MNWYTVNYLRATEENVDALNSARWSIAVRGLELQPVSEALERARREQYLNLNFLYSDVDGLGAEDFLFFFSESYRVSSLVLTDDEIDGILRARGSFSPWERRFTQCVSEDTHEMIKFFLGDDVSLLYYYYFFKVLISVL